MPSQFSRGLLHDDREGTMDEQLKTIEPIKKDESGWKVLLKVALYCGLPVLGLWLLKVIWP
ncbi:MAG: hypothetical protein KGL53_11340 [Elusimicrobia bacterium]|nr:hypothetical protein [Elusimicrobiota bacterium]